MSKYKFKYWYEWGNSGGCLWAADDVTREKYGYNPEISNLPLSKDLILFLNETGCMHDDALNWNYPPDSPDPKDWTPEMEAEFDCRAHEAYVRLCAELGVTVKYSTFHTKKKPSPILARVSQFSVSNSSTSST